MIQQVRSWLCHVYDLRSSLIKALFPERLLVECEYLLATTGRGNGRGHGGQLEMPQDACDHRLLGDDRNDAECAPSAKRTGAHIETKDAAQQSGPRPVRGGRWRLLPVQPLLARGGDDAFAQVAVRRQAAAIAHQMDVGQGDQRSEEHTSEL